MIYTGLIYRITNTVNGKIYIGQTSRELEKRMWEHQRFAKMKKPYKLSRAINKYGWDAFSVDVVAECSSFNLEDMKSDLDKLETYYIQLYDAKVSGYNMTDGGEGTVGIKHTDDWKKMMSEIGKTWVGDKSSKWGKPTPEITKKRMSEAANNRKRPVLQYTVDGEFIKRYGSVIDAETDLQLNKGAHKNIQACCKGRKKIAYGYVWKYE